MVVWQGSAGDRRPYADQYWFRNRPAKDLSDVREMSAFCKFLDDLVASRCYVLTFHLKTSSVAAIAVGLFPGVIGQVFGFPIGFTNGVLP
jgi:hypothetical protein